MARILVVDDSGLSRRTLRRILESEGHHVMEAEDGAHALEQYFLETPDLVLLDLVMKGLYGIDVLTKLRELDESARVIVATADIQSSTHVLAKDAGAVGFITKPFIVNEVLATVRQALAAENHGII